MFFVRGFPAPESRSGTRAVSSDLNEGLIREILVDRLAIFDLNGSDHRRNLTMPTMAAVFGQLCPAPRQPPDTFIVNSGGGDLRGLVVTVALASMAMLCTRRGRRRPPSRARDNLQDWRSSLIPSRFPSARNNYFWRDPSRTRRHFDPSPIVSCATHSFRSPSALTP